MTQYQTKQEIIDEISDLIAVGRYQVSRGSTEPRQLLVDVIRQLGISADTAGTKPELAQRIVQAAGLNWDLDCESRGSTVTRIGLIRVLDSVHFFLD
jgi:hypothetical protein